MQLTTHQIYALFAITVAVVVLIGISYISGLRTGRTTGFEQGRTSAANYWRKLLKAKRQANEEIEAQLGRANRQLSAAQCRIEEMIAYPTPFTAADVATLRETMQILKLTIPMLEAIDCSRLSRTGHQTLASVHSMIERINQAMERDRNHPDAILLDWLEANADVDFDLENATLRFPSSSGNEIGVESTRALLRQAKAESEAIEAQAFMPATQEAAA